ncbi:MAG: sulfatase [Planctomycetota bacterium]
MTDNSQELKADADHPNILFIHAESMDGRKMGCMGNGAMTEATPHLDSLAERGTLFTEAYSNCPVCNPSRASMWSGKYPHFYDCWNNHEGLDEAVPTFRTTFQRAGYRTAAIGPLDYQWGKHSIRDRIGSWTRSAEIHRPISRTPMPQIADDDQPTWGGDWERTHQATNFLRKAAGGDRPFMLYLTTGLVHPAFCAQKQYLERINEDEIQIPPTLGGLDRAEHPVDKYMRITKNCSRPFSPSLVRKMRHIYYAMISTLDDMVGHILRTLRDLGLSESTYIVFSSDHGEMAGEHNQILKRSMYEASVHEPLIIAGPDVEQGATVSRPVSLIDLYPTLMDMARISYNDFASHPRYPDSLDGQSLMPLLGGENDPSRRDWVFGEYNGDRCCTGSYMLRRGRWKYIKHVGYNPKLFDLQDDPWEENNVAAEKPEIAAEMEGILADNFACEQIDARAKSYDRQSFRQWRRHAREEGTYRETMAHVYSGYDRQSIEELRPWREEDEQKIEQWLGE